MRETRFRQAFLLLVDTLPFYDADVREQVEVASAAADVAAKVAERNTTTALTITDRWRDVRDRLGSK